MCSYQCSGRACVECNSHWACLDQGELLQRSVSVNSRNVHLSHLFWKRMQKLVLFFQRELYRTLQQARISYRCPKYRCKDSGVNKDARLFSVRRQRKNDVVPSHATAWVVQYPPLHVTVWQEWRGKKTFEQRLVLRPTEKCICTEACLYSLTNFIGFRNGGLECYITNPREAVDFRQSDSRFWASSCKNMEETQPIHIIPGLPVSCLSGGYLHPLLDVLGGIPPPPPPFHQFRGYLCVQSCQPFTSLEWRHRILFWMFYLDFDCNAQSFAILIRCRIFDVDVALLCRSLWT